MIISHNMGALNTQRQLKINRNNKAKVTEKLVSGYKINRAADDAAGLSISEKMRRQIRGLSQGVENTQDGVSLCQVADGALAEVNEMLHRITELSVQAANDTNTEEDRQAIQEEINQILEDIDRISETTSFNELHLFKNETTAGSETVSTPSVIGVSETRVTSGGTKEDFVRNSLNITGTAVGLAKDTYTIDANNQGITINGTTIAWSEVKDNNGNVINDNSIVESSYAFEYNGLTISFNTNVDTTIEDVINAIAGTKFQIDENSIQKNVVSISNVSIAPGTVADEILVGNPLVERKRLYFKADDEGISIQLGSDPPYTKKTWAELGIDDWSNAGGKSFNFTDSVTGVSFTGTIEANTSKEKVIESMNGIFFEWDYIDRNVSTDTFKGITVSSNDGTITNNFSDIKLTELWFQHEYGTISGLYSDMGYTTPSDIMNGVELRITLETGNANNYILKATSEKGAEKSITLNTSDLFDGRNFLQFGGQSNTNEKATITTSGKYAANKKLELLDNYVGQGNKIEIATVTLPSPYEYSLVPNKVTSIQMYMSGFTTNGGNAVNPPASTPSTPNQPIPPIQNPSGELDKVPDGKLCLWIQSGCDAGDGMFLEIDRMNTSILGIDDIDVSTSEGANHTLDVIGGALEKVSSNRAKIGAQQNRLEHTIANKENIVENTTAAESRIRDTDMADFMVKLSKENILEQVGQSMLAQANQSTSAVLNLLK